MFRDAITATREAVSEFKQGRARYLRVRSTRDHSVEAFRNSWLYTVMESTGTGFRNYKGEWTFKEKPLVMCYQHGALRTVNDKLECDAVHSKAYLEWCEIKDRLQDN